MKKVIKTIGLIFCFAILMAGCHKEDIEEQENEGEEPMTIAVLEKQLEEKTKTIDVSEVKDYRLVEEDLSKPPYSDGFTNKPIHQIPLAQQPDWLSYVAYTYGQAIICRADINGEYIYNINRTLSSSYGYEFDYNGIYLGPSSSNSGLNWELVCVTGTEVIENYDAKKEMLHHTENPLVGRWIVDPTSENTTYWLFSSSGIGESYNLVNGKKSNPLYFLYSAKVVTLSDGREWIALKMAFEGQKLTHNVFYSPNKSGDELTSVLSDHYKLRKVADK